MNQELKNKWADAFTKLHVRIKCNSYDQKSSALQWMSRLTGLPISDAVLESIPKQILLTDFPYVGVDDVGIMITGYATPLNNKVSYAQFMNYLKNETCPFAADPPKSKTFPADNLPVVEFYYHTPEGYTDHTRIVKLQSCDGKYLKGLEVLRDGKHQFKTFLRKNISSLIIRSFNPNAHTPDKKD